EKQNQSPMPSVAAQPKAQLICPSWRCSQQLLTRLLTTQGNQEARMAKRHESAVSPVLESANLPRSSITACVVRHLTKVGAHIEVPSTFDVPDTFNMTFDGGRTIQPCRLVWRSFNQVTVEFL